MLTIDEHSNGKELELGVGESFELRLPEKPTAGYQWKELPVDPSLLTCERIREDVVSRAADGGLIAGGQHSARWQGRAIREGTAVLELHYEGPTKQLAKRFNVTIHAKPR
jgi:predicted secreted protein